MIQTPPSNPYVVGQNDLTPETQPLDVIIRNAIQNSTLKLRVWLPAQVTKVLGNQKVNIQPLLQGRYTNGTPFTLPEVQNVMVSMPMGAGYSIKVPVAVGDTGVALFCDRSLDVWSAGSGELVDPQDTRQHDLNDPIFIPGLVPFSEQTTDSTTDLIITNGKAKGSFQAGGTFKFQNDANELIDLLSQTLQALTEATTNTIFGPQFLNNFATFQDLLTKMNTLKGS